VRGPKRMLMQSTMYGHNDREVHNMSYSSMSNMHGLVIHDRFFTLKQGHFMPQNLDRGARIPLACAHPRSLCFVYMQFTHSKK
jgi:hypothetical protein